MNLSGAVRDLTHQSVGVRAAALSVTQRSIRTGFAGSAKLFAQLACRESSRLLHPGGYRLARCLASDPGCRHKANGSPAVIPAERIFEAGKGI
jgi:hypothetical protein